MAAIEFPWDPPRRTLRQFGVLLVAFSLLVGWWVHKARGGWDVSAAIVAGAALLAAIGWFAPRVLRVVWIGWMLAAFPIGWVVSHVILAAIFYLVVAPIGIIMRLCGHDPLALRFDRQAASYWIRRPPTTDARRYFRQF